MLVFNPLEQGSVVTSAMVVLATAMAFYSLCKMQQVSLSFKLHIWMAAFLLIGIAEMDNGITMLEPGGPAGTALGKLVDLLRVLAAALFLCGAIYDLLGQNDARRLVFTSLAFGITFWLVDTVTPQISILALVYQVLIMLASFIVYSWLASRFQSPGAAWMALGVACFLVAVLLAEQHRDRIEWFGFFDGSILANVFQFFGLITLAIGLHKSLVPPVFVSRGISGMQPIEFRSKIK